MHSFLCWQFDFRAGQVVFITIDDGPNRVVSQRPAAREQFESQRREKRFPILADQERRDAPFQGSHASSGFGIAGGNTVPDAPYVLPALPPDSIEESKLQI